MTNRGVAVPDLERQRASLLAVLVTEKESDEVQRDSLSYLLECVLASSSEPQSLPTLCDGIEAMYSLRYPGFRVQHALDLLLKRGDIQRVKGPAQDLYVLSGARLSAVNAQLESNRRFVDSVMAEWVGSTRAERPQLTDDDETQLVLDVKAYMGRWVKHYGSIKAAAVGVGTGVHPIFLRNLGQFVDERWVHCPPGLRAIAAEALSAFLAAPTDLRTRYLDRYFESHAELCLQYVTEVGEGYPFGDDVSNHLILLDTNVVLALLGHDWPAQETVRAMVDASRSLGLSVAVTARTKAEFLRLLDIADRLYRSLGGPARVRRELAAAATRQRVDNIFIDSFLRRRASGRNETWSQFCARNRQLVTLLRDYQVLVVADLPIADVTKDRLDFLDSLVGRFGPGKSPAVRQHDVLHYLMVREWRAEGSDKWSSWFITLDSGLPFFDEEARRSEVDPGLAFCISPECWLTWLRKTTPARLTGAAGTSGIGALAFSLPLYRDRANAAVMVRLIATINDWQEDPADLVLAIANEEWLHEEARQAYVKSGWGAVPELDRALAKAVSGVSDERTEAFREQLAALQQQVEALSSERLAGEVERQEREDELRTQLAEKDLQVGSAARRAEIEEQLRRQAQDDRRRAAQRSHALIAGLLGLSLSLGLLLVLALLKWDRVLAPLCLSPLLVGASYPLWRKSVKWRAVILALLLVTAAIPVVSWVYHLVRPKPEVELLWQARLQTLGTWVAVAVAAFAAGTAAEGRRASRRG